MNDGAKVSFAGEIWGRLSKVDCSKHIEKKQNLSYLSWAWAWGLLMSEYPESRFEFDDPHEFPDGTIEIWVTVEIIDGERKFSRRIWLPCMDHRNQPIKNPTSMQINTTRMRCLTKCMSLFGLGHHIYAGEDVPRPENDAPPASKKDNSVAGAVLDGEKFDQDMRREYVAGISAAVFNEDEPGLFELLDELKADAIMKVAVWQQLDSKTRSTIKKLEASRREAEKLEQ